MKALPRALAPGLALAAALGLAPAAQAATVVSPSPCVRIVPGAPTFPVQAAGFPAGAFITFKTGADIVGSGTADPAGNFDNSARTRSTPPSIPFDKNRATVQLTADDGAGTVAGPVPVPVSRITVDVPTRSKPRKRVNFRVFGFEAEQEGLPAHPAQGQDQGPLLARPHGLPVRARDQEDALHAAHELPDRHVPLLLLALQEVRQVEGHLRRQGDDLPHLQSHCRPLRRRQPAPGAEAPRPGRGGFA